jgi:diaminopimelate decarboxylase
VFSGAFADIDSMVCYAMKANSNQAVLKTLAQLGSGVDVVSEGELRRALAAGIPASKIMFSGVGKTAREMDARARRRHLLLQHRIRARARGAQRPRTGHGQGGADLLPHQSRCRREDPCTRSRPARRKTSSAFPGSARAAVYRRAASLPGVRVTGIDMHIGSQITDLQPFDDALKLMVELIGLLRADGHTIDHFDIGGGLGVPYRDDNAPPPDPDAYGEMVKAGRPINGCKVILEPGRMIVANAGVSSSRKSSMSRMAATRPSSSSMRR